MTKQPELDTPEEKPKRVSKVKPKPVRADMEGQMNE